MPKCAACGKFMALADGASCCKCRGLFHLACAGLPEKSKVPTNWACTECKSKVPRKNSDVTPAKLNTVRDGKQPASNLDVFMSPSNTMSESSIISELKCIREELYATRNELKEFRNEMACISSSLLACNERIDEIENRLECIEKRFEDHISNNDGSLEATVDQLKADLNDREQDLLLNDIDITGIPETKGENPSHIVMLIAAKLNIKIDDRDIMRAERIGPAHGTKEGENATRPIVVRLSRKSLRDDLLRAACIWRGADTADMNIPGNPRKFYVNERLTKNNRQLFKKTRIAAKKFKWKFTWTREGRIYTKQNEGKPSHRIKSELDILRFFSIDHV